MRPEFDQDLVARKASAEQPAPRAAEPSPPAELASALGNQRMQAIARSAQPVPPGVAAAPGSSVLARQGVPGDVPGDEWGDSGYGGQASGGSAGASTAAPQESGYGYGDEGGLSPSGEVGGMSGGGGTSGGAGDVGYGYEFGDDPLAAGGFGASE